MNKRMSAKNNKGSTGLTNFQMNNRMSAKNNERSTGLNIITNFQMNNRMSAKNNKGSTGLNIITNFQMINRMSAINNKGSTGLNINIKYQTNLKKKYRQRKTVDFVRKGCTDRVTRFCTLIQDGPNYICVCCHRGHYKISVHMYNTEKCLVKVEQHIELVSSHEILHITYVTHVKLS